MHLTYVTEMKLSHIILKCKSNSRIAQNELFIQYAPIFYSIAQRYIKNSHTAEDIVSKSFYKIFTKINDYNGQGSFEGWMKRIVINECLMELRKNKNFSLTLSIDQLTEDIKVDWEDRLGYEEILSLLDSLPDGYRTVFNLYVIEGYKHREIAEILNISINTSKSQLILARRKLQLLLKKKLNYKLAL